MSSLIPNRLLSFSTVCVVGEADEMLPEFINTYKTFPDRHEMLREVVKIGGVYVPKFYTVAYNPDGTIMQQTGEVRVPEKVRKRSLKTLSVANFTTAIITPETEFSEMYLIEAMRGCPWNCRFCVTGRVYNPPRKKELHNIRDEIQTALTRTKRIGLIGPSLSDYAYIREVLRIPEVDFSIPR